MNAPVLFLLLVLLLAAPQPEGPAIDPKVEEAVQEAIRLRHKAFLAQCRVIAVERASSFVDSLLRSQAPTTSEDSLVPPPRPERPELEPVDIDEDTMPLQPLLPTRRQDRQ